MTKCANKSEHKTLSAWIRHSLRNVTTTAPSTARQRPAAARNRLVPKSPMMPVTPEASCRSHRNHATGNIQTTAGSALGPPTAQARAQNTTAKNRATPPSNRLTIATPCRRPAYWAASVTPSGRGIVAGDVMGTTAPRTHSWGCQKTHRSCRHCDPTAHPGRRSFAPAQRCVPWRGYSVYRFRYQRADNSYPS